VLKFYSTSKSTLTLSIISKVKNLTDSILSDTFSQASANSSDIDHPIPI